MKKPTNWITIPEEKIHTPVSQKTVAKKISPANVQQVQNKVFWAVGFVALVIIAFAALAPKEFNSILKGDLFDAQGTPEQKLNLLPTAKQGKTPFDTATENTNLNEAETDTLSNKAEEENSNQPVIKPESEAVTIAVEPVGPKDCKQDINCFLVNLQDCTPAKALIDYELSGQFVSAVLQIKSVELNHCMVSVGFAQGPDASLEGKEATCRLAKGDYLSQESIVDFLSNGQLFSAQCEGEAAVLMSVYLESLKSQETVDAQSKLIEELNAKLNALSEQVSNNVKPSAPENNNIPSSITSTTTIGQPPVQVPGFRANPYVVNITPQQVLQQNLSGGVRIASVGAPTNTGSVVGSANQIPQQNQVLSGGRTPESGPAETLLLATLMTYLAFIAWKSATALKS